MNHRRLAVRSPPATDPERLWIDPSNRLGRDPTLVATDPFTARTRRFSTQTPAARGIHRIIPEGSTIPEETTMSDREGSIHTAADELNLLPTPRELELGETRHDLTGWEIVVPEGVDLAEIAAEEINDRVRDLGGAPLPVTSRPTGRPALFVGRWHDPEIRPRTTALDVTLTPSDPGEQGSVVAFGEHEDRPVAILGGSDAQGVLYAAVTFRRLLEPADESDRNHSAVLAREAHIRDWPDFEVRNVARLNLDALRRTDATLATPEPLSETAESLKREVDFWLRHKVNCLFTTPFFPDAETDPELFERQRALAREVISYARERGITLRYVGGVEIGKYLTDEEQNAAIERQPGAHYEWAAFDVHRARAERYAAFLAESHRGDVSGVARDIFSLHLDDQGGYVDPERWSQRSAATRVLYGDDRARATEEQFELYFQAVRDAVSGTAIEAISYPYHFQFAREDFPETYEELSSTPVLAGLVAPIEDPEHARTLREDLLAYHRHLAETLADDVAIVFREADRETFETAADLYGDHPLTLWIYPDRNNGWKGTFTPQVRMVKTFYRPDRRDPYFLASVFSGYGDGRIQRLAQLEYLWAVDRPDTSTEFDHEQRGYETGGEVTPFQREHLIPRIARICYGDAADAVEDLLAANASFQYVADPVGVVSGQHDAEEFANVYEHIEEQARIFEAAHEEVPEEFEDANGDDSRPWLAFYHRYTGLAAVKAELEATAETCRELIRADDPGEAIEEAKAAIEALVGMTEECNRLRETIPGRLPDRISKLDEFDPGEFESTFEELIALAEAVQETGGRAAYVREQLEAKQGEAAARIESFERTDRTVTYGYATVLGLRIELVVAEAVRDSLAERAIEIEVFGSGGEEIVAMTRPAEQFAGSWVGGRPLKVDLGDTYDGDLRVEVSFAEGESLGSVVVSGGS